MKVAIAAILMVIAIIFTGCSTQPAAAEGPMFQEVYQKLSDGRTVLCLYREGRIGGYSSGTAPTMSCDWAGAVVHP